MENDSFSRCSTGISSSLGCSGMPTGRFGGAGGLGTTGEQAPWLLVYLKRWLGLGLLSFALGCAGSPADPTGWAALPVHLSLPSLAVDSVIVVCLAGAAPAAGALRAAPMIRLLGFALLAAAVGIAGWQSRARSCRRQPGRRSGRLGLAALAGGAGLYLLTVP